MGKGDPKTQCTQFTTTGERCSMWAISGESVCSSHDRATTLRSDIEDMAPLGLLSSQRDVSRRVATCASRRWPSVEFDFRIGKTASNEDVMVLLWTDGPSVKQVRAELRGLYDLPALGWGLPYGPPGVEFSRSPSPEVLVAFLIEQALSQQPEHPGKTVGRAWVRRLLRPALDAFEAITEPEVFMTPQILDSAKSIIDKCPPNRKTLIDDKWLPQVCLMVMITAERLDDRSSLPH